MWGYEQGRQAPFTSHVPTTCEQRSQHDAHGPMLSNVPLSDNCRARQEVTRVPTQRHRLRDYRKQKKKAQAVRITFRASGLERVSLDDRNAKHPFCLVTVAAPHARTRGVNGGGKHLVGENGTPDKTPPCDCASLLYGVKVPAYALEILPNFSAPEDPGIEFVQTANSTQSVFKHR